MDNITDALLAEDLKVNSNNKNRKLQTETEHIIKFLKSIPIFCVLDDTTLNQIAKLGSQKSFTKSSVILSESEKSSALFLIIKGKLKVSRISLSGKEIILTILKESDFFGEMAILDGSSRSANVIAMEDSELFIIQRNDFLNLIKFHSNIALALMRELALRIRAADLKIKSLSLGDAEAKIASTIIELGNKIGRLDQNKIEIGKLPFQHELAKMAGTSRETVSRILHSFDRRGLIKLKGSKLTILDYFKFRELYE